MNNNTNSHIAITDGLEYHDAIYANTSFNDDSSLPLDRVIWSTSDDDDWFDILVPIAMLPDGWETTIAEQEDWIDETSEEPCAYELDGETPIYNDPQGTHVWFHPTDDAYYRVTPSDRWIQHVYLWSDERHG